MDTGEIISWEMWPRLVGGEVKNTWSYTTTPSVCREKFNLLLLIIKPTRCTNFSNLFLE